MKEEELNFDAEKPLTDFENQVGLNSLRRKYLAEEEIWLNNETLNDLADPDNKSEYSFDENEQAVLNRYSEVQIGTKIIKELNEDQIQDINQAMQRSSKFKKTQLVKENATLVIDDADYNTLIEFNEGDMSVIENNNVTVQQASSDCRSRVSKKVKRYYDNNNRMVRLKVKLRSFLSLSTRSKAKIES